MALIGVQSGNTAMTGTSLRILLVGGRRYPRPNKACELVRLIPQGWRRSHLRHHQGRASSS